MKRYWYYLNSNELRIDVQHGRTLVIPWLISNPMTYTNVINNNYFNIENYTIEEMARKIKEVLVLK